jgi:MoxR-like ATPase
LLMATQNPVELEGTFTLPEAQLDRFMLRLKLGYPSEDEEGTILCRFQEDNPLNELSAVTDAKELLKLQKICRRVFVDESIRNYVVSVTRATRTHPDVKLAASPRASLSLHQAAQSLAAIRGRSYVIPDDIKYLAVPALAHRLMAKTEARLRGRSAEDIIKEILNQLPVPVEGTT